MHLYGLSIDGWTTTRLDKLASQVGTLLFTNRYTKMRERVNYARVLVEANISQPLSQHIAAALLDERDVGL